MGSPTSDHPGDGFRPRTLPRFWLDLAVPFLWRQKYRALGIVISVKDTGICPVEPRRRDIFPIPNRDLIGTLATENNADRKPNQIEIVTDRPFLLIIEIQAHDLLEIIDHRSPFYLPFARHPRFHP
jgi:hypothetical protein